MTYLREETDKNLDRHKAPGRVWFAVIATDAMDFEDRVSVKIIGMDGGAMRWEDLRWQPRNNTQMPKRGDECVIVMDESGEMWVSVWWPDVVEVGDDLVVPANQRILASKLVATDTQPAFRIMGDGKIEWGSGGSNVPDTFLYRIGVGELMVQSDAAHDPGMMRFGNNGGWPYITLESVTDGGAGISFAVDGTPNSHWEIYVTGGQDGISFFSGASGHDMARFRSTDLWLRDPGKLVFGTLQDTNLYRTAANVLRTDGDLRIVGSLAVVYGAAGQSVLGVMGGGESALRFGTGLDTNLYRASAGVFATDSALNMTVAGASADRSLLTINFNGVGMKTLQVGATDSGGSGFRMVRVTN